jgi:hypothetical protein
VLRRRFHLHRPSCDMSWTPWTPWYRVWVGRHRRCLPARPWPWLGGAAPAAPAAPAPAPGWPPRRSSWRPCSASSAAWPATPAAGPAARSPHPRRRAGLCHPAGAAGSRPPRGIGARRHRGQTLVNYCRGGTARVGVADCDSQSWGGDCACSHLLSCSCSCSCSYLTAQSSSGVTTVLLGPGSASGGSSLESPAASAPRRRRSLSLAAWAARLMSWRSR